MQVELVDFVSVPTRNTARAVAWYRHVLGLPPSKVTEGELEAFRDPDGNALILHRRYAPRTRRSRD